MRIDLFLKQSRLIKRRTVAQQACEKGLVLVNEKQVKAGFKVKENDQITLNLGLKQIKVIVTSLKFVKDELMYQLVSEKFMGQS